MHFALVSSEISPFVSGGIAPMVRATAQILAGAGHQVDIFTRAAFEPRAAELSEDPPAVLRHPRIRWHWVAEPSNDAEQWHLEMAQSFSAALRVAYRHARPDVIELQDYLGLGAFIAEDRTGLEGALVVTRLNTSSSQARALDGVAEFSTSADHAVDQLERTGLEHSDLLLSPSTAVEEYYRSFYDFPLPPHVTLWPGFLRDDAPRPQGPRPTGGPLELAFVGRLQTFKGIVPMIEALAERPDLDLRLSILGGDTATGPSGMSMRQHLRPLTDADPRIDLHGPVPREAIGTFLRGHDAVIVPSIWETWGNVGLEALGARRPLLVTPVASLPDMADHGRLGLVAPSADQAGIGAMLEQAVAERDRLVGLTGSAALSEHLDALTDETRLVQGYEALTAPPVRG